MSRSNNITHNWEETKQDIKDIGRLITAGPKLLVDPLFRRLGKSLVKQIPQAFEVTSALVDDINPLDVIEPLYRSVDIEASTWSDYFKDVKRVVKDMKKEASVSKRNRQDIERKKKDMKKTKQNSGNTGTSRTSVARQTTARTNHPEWYLKDPTMVKDLVGINISTRQNTILSYMKNGISEVDSAKDAPLINGEELSIPSCCGLQLELVLPKSITRDWEQGINMLYKNIRAANAGATNYSPAQLGYYVFTLRGIDAVLSTLGRAIKLLNSGTFYDAVSPQAYFTAMGLDYATFAENSANARELYSRLSAIRYRLMPLEVSLLDRTRWLFSNVFADSDDAKAQSYIPFCQRVPYITSQGELGYATIARMYDDLPNDATGLDWDFFSNQALEIFDVYQSDAVFQIIAGDILKAYGKESLTKYPEISMSMTLKPVYDEHILTQIQNASLSATGALSVDFDSDSLESFGTMTVKESFTYDDSKPVIPSDMPVFPTQATALDTWFINPTYNANQDVTDPGRLLSSTRLMVSRHAVSAANNTGGVAYIEYDTYGTEIVTSMYVVVAAGSDVYGHGAYGLTVRNLTMFVTAATYRTRGLWFSSLPLWSWFDYFPLVIPIAQDSVNKRVVVNLPMFDFNNFGIAYKTSLDSYGAICTLSMLHKPFISRVNKVEVFDA